MKIDDSFNKTGAIGVGVAAAQTKASKGAEKTAVPSSATGGSDSVKISAEAQALSNSSTFDLKKVTEIKAAIASGTFQVDPEKVASGLIDTVRDLLSSRKG